MGKDKSNTMNAVRFLALRPLEASSQAFDGLGNHMSGVKMHRILIDNMYYKFTSDFEIKEEGTLFTLANNTPKELYEIRQKERTVGVNISAIVGENGSGKSTIIDHIIRIINNLSAVLFGEYYYNSVSEHLHYIQGVYAELFVLIDKKIYDIICQGEDISIKTFDYDTTVKSKEYYRYNQDKSYSFKANTKVPCERKDDCFEVLSEFCYTLIVNYSLYSFDNSSYVSELTEDEKENVINIDGIKNKYTNKDFEKIKTKAEETNDKTEYIEAKSWLPGILKKNDNYQRPISITPNRENGQVNQRKEYVIGKEKLLFLALLRDKNDRRFYTHINNKEEIDKITLSLDPEAAKRNYLSIFDDYFPKYTETVRLTLFNLVRQLIISKFDKDKTPDLESFDSPYKKTAWYYIVGEFFKILLTYSEHGIDKQSLQEITTRINSQTIKVIKEATNKIWGIHSYVTRHFWRSLFYLNYDYLPKNDSEAIKGINKSIVYKKRMDDYSSKAYSLIKDNPKLIHYIDELLPPQIFHIDFELFSIDDTAKKNVIPFETLSSGEKQVTLSLSTLFSFLTNLDSTSDEVSVISEHKEEKEPKGKIISYKHVCVFFDELELYYHPEMQRTFVNRLLLGLKQLDFNTIKSIQFIMATHSPFILSDVSKTNVLFLDRDGHPQDVDNMHTFGANIHTMLKHSFFLKDSTIGAFAKKVIGEVEACLKIYKLCPENKEDIVVKKLKRLKELIIDETGFELSDPYKLLEPFIERNNEGIIEQFHFGEFKSYYSKERIRATIDLFDEPIIKKVLLDDYYEIFPDDRANEELIVSLERQLTELKNTIQSSKNGDSAFVADLISQIENKLKELKK